MPRRYVCLAVSVAVAVVACSSGRMMQEPPIEKPVETASGPPPPLADDPQTTVDHRYADLVAKRGELGIAAPARAADETCSPVCAVDAPPPLATQTCPAAAGSANACAATCARADAICDDADKICEIAKQQNVEAALAGRCHEAVATCAVAIPACCGCQ